MGIGNESTVYPTLVIVIVCYISHLFLGLYGISLVGVGAICNLPATLTIEIFAPIIENVSKIIEHCESGKFKEADDKDDENMNSNRNKKGNKVNSAMNRYRALH
jgi:Na+/H+-translocating membrane pyrophosphatase